MQGAKAHFVVLALGMVVWGACVGAAEPKTALLDEIGAARGICVVLGDTRCELALKLVRDSELVVYVQLTRAEDAKTGRRIVDEAGLYGTRIFIAKGPLTKLHLADNIADALIATGSVNYDGAYVYALDAATGRIRWQNSTSGHLDPQARSGVSVQGHLLLNNGKLYLAGGNAVSPAIYDTKDGKCLNTSESVQQITQNNVLLSHAPRGWELSLLGDRVVDPGNTVHRLTIWPCLLPACRSEDSVSNINLQGVSLIRQS